MASTTFTDKQTVIQSEWCNEVDAVVHDILGAPTTDAEARTNLGVAAGGAGDIWVEKAGDTMTGQLLISRTDSGATCLDLTVTENGAFGPKLALRHTSTSPAANDAVGVISFLGLDSGAASEEYVKTFAQILDPTATSEDSAYQIQTMIAGTLTTVLTVGPGAQVGAPTGGDKGSGTLNVATNYYRNNVAQGVWTNFTPTVTLVGGAGNTVPVYSTNTGRYSRVGDTIHVSVYLTGDGGAEGAGTGVVSIALPATASASAPTGPFPAGFYQNSTAEGIVTAQIPASATVVSLGRYDSATNHTDLIGDDQNNATRTIRLQFTYEAVA